MALQLRMRDNFESTDGPIAGEINHQMCQVARLRGSLTTRQGDVAQRQPQVVNYVELQELSYKIGQLSYYYPPKV